MPPRGTKRRRPTPLRFPGQYHDPETGFHHNYFRHYDPETARYASPDPSVWREAPIPRPTSATRAPGPTPRAFPIPEGPDQALSGSPRRQP
ncbi:RHS repeat-associated core domain-containing protein [Streptomyces sp. M19]